jgi:hypothetical protein
MGPMPSRKPGKLDHVKALYKSAIERKGVQNRKTNSVARNKRYLVRVNHKAQVNSTTWLLTSRFEKKIETMDTIQYTGSCTQSIQYIYSFGQRN